MKTYLQLGKPIVNPTEDECARELRYADKWVDKLEEGTAEYRPAAEATQKDLKVETTLVEIPDAHQMESKWVICKEESEN